jgi:hypothetical protein
VRDPTHDDELVQLTAAQFVLLGGQLFQYSAFEYLHFETWKICISPFFYKPLLFEISMNFGTEDDTCAVS